MIRIIIALFVVFCSMSSAFAADTSSEQWPRTFVNADGSTTIIPNKPMKLLSTSVTLTGTLVAIDAPVVASSTAGDGKFFSQWEAVAKQRKITELWPVGGVDTEMAYAVMPDLIVVAKTGGDSVLDLVPELKLLAPVIVVDYGSQTWQELAIKLGYATGREDFVKQKIAEFDQYVEATKLNLPAKQANIIRYNGPGMANAIAKVTGPHSELIHALGFEIEGAKDEWETFSDKRNDFARVHYETLTLLKAPVSFVIVADESSIQTLLKDPVLVNLPSVKQKQVYELGLNSFRIDYYSSLEIIELMKKHFGLAQ
ncbi:Fe2+-enterobactin ABC transporter substrate-binding protein [Vibrio diazotrophicus]|uniref:Fe2+-enterobactin ABC transporter substrate-binding protein n=1 Tax=Vibrio diazotrophicus TaxID=685 RepID=UPI000C9E1308|nr:Fe2+-enterobactin ABC transporter substrate-binding protein [Vibrio diazotrophicus]PNH82107.1 Fe2+-enterobactin ABC transporter substrate-binding protein [Vibrio diazotrophicus]